jgi:small conductance mechanosensitive channel
MDANLWSQNLVTWVTYFGLRLLGALAVWLVGRWLIGLALRLERRALERQAIDPTLIRYACSATTVILNIALIVALLGYFGVETTTFAALVAGVGVAIGAAWAGLLANFAAGVFLVVLRPFRTGHVVTAGGVTGTVEEIGLFATTLNTADNVRTIVGNNKILSDTIQNFSANPYRRVDLTAQLHRDVDPDAAMALLKQRLAGISNVKATPGPDVSILAFNALGPVLAVRPYCDNRDYWQVYFDTNRVIRDAFGEAGYPEPVQRIMVGNSSG